MAQDRFHLPLCPTGQEECACRRELRALQTELRMLEQRVRTDALTGLFNYRHFQELLPQEVERARRSAQPVALIMMDLDHFKAVNDTWGHEIGNRVLRQVALLLQAQVRKIDFVCRYGGEEFAVVLPGANLSKAVKVAERLRQAIAAAALEPEDGMPSYTASLGVEVFPGVASDASELVRRADRFLYRAKSLGRNRVAHPEIAPPPPALQVSAEEKAALLETERRNKND